MRLVNLLREEASISLVALVAVSAISGLSNALILVIVNAAIEDTAAGTHTVRLLILFATALAIYLITRRHVLATTASEIEKILHKIRIRIADRIRKSDLLTLESIGRSEIFAAVQRETITISTGTGPAVMGIQAFVLALFSDIYLAWLSLPAFIVFNSLLLIGIWNNVARKKRLSTLLDEALARANRLFDALSYVLDGFKEVKLNAARSEDLYSHLQDRSRSATDLKIEVETEFANLSVFAQACFHITLGSIVFLLPNVAPEFHDVVIKVVATFLFVMGPIFTVVNTFPEILRAEAAAVAIHQMEQRLNDVVRPPVLDGAGMTSFRELRFEDVLFRFPDPKASRPFTVGPVDVSISAGETLFLTGGNGTGKSTLLKLLTALYRPQEGALRIDDTIVDESNRQAYQALFSVIFSDFYLFDRLYGLGEVDPEKVDELLREMELEEKTRFVDGEFETLDLSTGQRKRLALLVTLLEDRPIYVFDEWAAEQDPTFRKKFYNEILPRLKARGKTIIAVTHDDRYFNVADRVLQMDEGKLRTYRMG